MGQKFAIEIKIIDTKLYDLWGTGTISYRNGHKNKDGVILGQTFIGERKKALILIM